MTLLTWDIYPMFIYCEMLISILLDDYCFNMIRNSVRQSAGISLLVCPRRSSCRRWSWFLRIWTRPSWLQHSFIRSTYFSLSNISLSTDGCNYVGQNNLKFTTEGAQVNEIPAMCAQKKSEEYNSDNCQKLRTLNSEVWFQGGKL